MIFLSFYTYFLCSIFIRPNIADPAWSGYTQYWFVVIRVEFENEEFTSCLQQENYFNSEPGNFDSCKISHPLNKKIFFSFSTVYMYTSCLCTCVPSESPHINQAYHGWSKCSGIYLIALPDIQYVTKSQTYSYVLYKFSLTPAGTGSVFYAQIQIFFGTV